MQQGNYQILYEQEHFLIVVKPSGLPTVPLSRDPEGRSLLIKVSHEFPEIMQSSGTYAHEGLVLHRLDTETCGLVLIARSKKFYSHIQDAQRAGLFIKHYRAAVSPMPLIEGFPLQQPKNIEKCEMFIESWFRPYGVRRQAVRPVISTSSPIALQKRGAAWHVTRVSPIGENVYGEQVVQCGLNRGFRHQVRCHLAWSGTPIIGDSLYGGLHAESLRLAATKMSFPNMESHEILNFQWNFSPEWAQTIDRDEKYI
jgi:23S rRNA pseudouridine1911/1915/1917 synthase